MEVYNHGKDSVVSKRDINALITSYLVELERTYFVEYPKYRKTIYETPPYLKNSKDKKVIQMAKFIAWPFTARLQRRNHRKNWWMMYIY